MGLVMSGARAKVGIVDPATGLVRIVGIYSSVDYALTYATEAAFILGRFSAGANEYVSQDIIRLTCSGFRIINHGPDIDGGMPTLQNMLTSDYIQLALIDRQGELQGVADARFQKFFSVRCTGFSTSGNSRSLLGMTVHYESINLGSETFTNSEGPGATFLPTT